ncbi:MAG: hypothetical protein E7415_05945 [Ruminococcaceae bacterium]|nr:hypothetical protein [Oscillospiraceae bacterium]
MLTNSSAVLYHYNEKSENWVRTFFPCAFVFRSTDSSVSSGNLSQSNRAVIRIPDYAKTDISIGDYLLIGKSNSTEPDSSLCFKVTAFSKNTFGSSPHLKIICS